MSAVEAPKVKRVYKKREQREPKAVVAEAEPVLVTAETQTEPKAVEMIPALCSLKDPKLYEHCLSFVLDSIVNKRRKNKVTVEQVVQAVTTDRPVKKARKPAEKKPSVLTQAQLVQFLLDRAAMELDEAKKAAIEAGFGGADL